MIYRISKPAKSVLGRINPGSSKSECNRLLIIRALCSEKFKIENLSDSEDTQTLKDILDRDQTSGLTEETYDVKAGGTTMRFLISLFANTPGTRILTGSDRMKGRPVGILVEALKSLGAEIDYLGKKGYPPLRISGKKLSGGQVEMDGNISSQFISSLLLCAPAMEKGIEIKLRGEVVSRPYIKMTLKIMETFGVLYEWSGDTITIKNQTYTYNRESAYKVEADWSSASYYYAIAALSSEADIFIEGLKKESMQGDSILSELFKFFGVHSDFEDDGIRLFKKGICVEEFGFDYSSCPDIVQTLAVVLSALKVPALFNGLSTLKIKETNRIEALQKELNKIGAEVNIIDEHSIEINPAGIKNSNGPVRTYEDHRMAMAFTCLAMVSDHIDISDPEVVNKSYPGFWGDLRSLGFKIDSV